MLEAQQGRAPDREAQALHGLVARARGRCRAARARNTERAYRSDYVGYVRWAVLAGATPLPPTVELVLGYLESLVERGLSPRSLRRRVAGLRSMFDGYYGRAHAARAEEVDRWVEGMLRTVSRPLRQARALTVEELEAVARAVDGDLGGQRDRTMFVLGFAGGFRRSELAALDVEDLEFGRGFVRVWVRSGKSDQRRVGLCKRLVRGRQWMTCPVRQLRRWLRLSGVKSGALFRLVDQDEDGRWHVTEERVPDRLVNDRLQMVAERGGVDVEGLRAHSLRAGCITRARTAGYSDGEIQRLTGHRDARQIGRYDRGDSGAVVRVL